MEMIPQKSPRFFNDRCEGRGRLLLSENNGLADQR